MDLGSPEHRRNNKRSYSQMSQALPPLQSLNSPLPQPQNNSRISAHYRTEVPRPFEPARSPRHFDNNITTINNMPRGEMMDRRLPMPRLHHQASNTIIDLTSDNDPPSSQGRRSSQRAVAPPQLERSDSITLGAEVISIDSDDEDEVQFVSEQPRPPIAPSRPPPPPITRRIEPYQAHHTRPSHNLLQRHHSRHVARPSHRLQGVMDYSETLFRSQFSPWSSNEARARLQLARQNDDRLLFFGEMSRMPGVLNIGHNPFGETQPERKQEHIPPPKAREGFTRSPKEDDVCVCPACDEELKVDPREMEALSEKKPTSKKGPSKADRAEHPFWVVRECGHLYCNRCFHKRKPEAKSKASPLFPLKSSSTKKSSMPVCAVEGCSSEVGEKRHWIGVFL